MFLTEAKRGNFTIKYYRGVAQLGRALGSGPRGRVFESPHSDQKNTAENSAVFFAFFYGYSFIRLPLFAFLSISSSVYFQISSEPSFDVICLPTTCDLLI